MKNNNIIMAQEICCFVFVWDEMMAVFYVNGTVLFLVWKLFLCGARQSGNNFSLQHHCCILAAVCFFFAFFYFSSHSIHGIMYSKTNPPNVTSFLSIYSTLYWNPTHTTETFNECYFLIFILFASKELHLIPWATEITLHFFLVVFHYFPFYSSFFLLLYFIILTELLSASIKLPIFSSSISFFVVVGRRKDMEGGLQRNSIFQCLNKFTILSRSLLLRLQCHSEQSIIDIEKKNNP